MKKTELINSPALSNTQSKDSHFFGQMSRVFQSFSVQPKTMLMVEIETGIMRSNICRYVAKWRKSDRIGIVKKSVCPISKSDGVQFLSTNLELIPRLNRQLNIFDND